MKRKGRGRLSGGLLLVVSLAAASIVVLPAGAARTASGAPNGLLQHLSQAAAQHYWFTHPSQAAASQQAGIHAIEAAKAAGKKPVKGKAPGGGVFNADEVGLPQNEESVGVCSSKTRYVLEGTNDYRGLLDPAGNFTGWHFSNDGGKTLTNEGLLPELSIGGTTVPSGGDPVDVSDADCNLYAASLNYVPTADFFTEPNGIGVYRSDPATLASCPGGSDSSCWPTRRIVAASQGGNPGHFFDKEWMAVGDSGSAGTVVWVTFSDFNVDLGTELGYNAVQVRAVRCSADLSSCTAPILISGSDADIQFSDVTIGPDGRVYVSWAEIIGELPPSGPQTFVVKMRVAEPGSTTFGPTRIVATVDKAIPFGGKLQADDFRIATYPKNAVVMVGSAPRVFITWEECTARVFDTICELPVIKLTYSDDFGASWSPPEIASRGGVNYFPTISADPVSGRLALAWYTSQHDPTFNNRQDVVLASVSPGSGHAARPDRITRQSNEPEADPLLGGVFIGDYIEVFAYDGQATIGFNANYRQVPLLFEGVPVAQQDNYLTKVGF